MDRIVTSADNGTVKRIVRLKQKKYRDRDGEYFTEGLANVLDTAAAAPECVRLVVLSESAYSRYSDKLSRDFETVVFSDRLFEKVSETECASGILSINAIRAAVLPSSNGCILLDRVRDPGNVGTVLRTAVAAGYDAVLNNCADAYSPKAVRSAMSAIARCNLSFDADISAIKALGYEIIACDMGGENVFAAAPPVGKYCIVIGNEASGISDEVRAAADRTLALPQNGIESLNAAVAAGVMMYVLANIRK